MRRTALALAFAMLFAGAADAGSRRAAAGAATPAISAQTLRDVTRELSSDRYEGRAPATPAETLSIDYIAERFRAAGLHPGGPDGSWFQDVPMVQITGQNVRPMTFSGGRQPVTLQYRQDMVIATYRVTPNVDIRNSPVVFVGYGINAPERHWNDYAGIDVRGKTVVILVNDPDWQTMTSDECRVAPAPQAQASSGGRCDPPLFEGRAMTYYGRWTYKFEEAARQGAAAAIIVHQTEPAAYGWGVVQSSWTGPQLELDQPGDHLDQSQAIGWMQLGKARELFASAGQDFDALSAAARRPGFHAVPLGVTMSVGFETTIRRQASHNVIGILPGRTAPNEYVLYTAHWDHLGRCDPVNGDDICNGALDNASGVAGLVALAEAQAHAGPTRRSQVFMSVTAEESGLLGSRYYAEHPVYPLARTAGGVNMDVLNVHGRTRDFVITGAGKSQLEELVAPLAAAQGRRISPEPNPERGGYFRSDHFSFARQGVPMLDGAAGEDLVAGGTAAGHAATLDYIEHRYHKPQDEYDPRWDWSGAVQDLTLYYRLGRQLGDGMRWPNWYPSAEFRAIRDRSAAERR